MKKLLAALLVFTCSTGFAQNAGLTKDETVKYLNKKTSEIFGHARVIQEGGKTYNFYYYQNAVSLSGQNILISTLRGTYKEQQYSGSVYLNGRYYEMYPCDYYTDEYAELLNPAHIINIEKDPRNVAGEPVGLIKVTLTGKTARHIWKRKFSEGVVPDNHTYRGRCYGWRD